MLKTEKETIYWLMEHAKKIGAQEDLKHLFGKWDRIILLAPENEKVEMSRMAILEIQTLLDIHPESGDGLTINNELIIEGASEDKKWKPWKG